MKTCKTCNFLSNIKLGAGRTCLANSRITVEGARACEDYERGNAAGSFQKAGALLREVEETKARVKR
jgi:hypothetical protein